MEHQPPWELGLPYSVDILRPAPPYAVSGFKGRPLAGCRYAHRMRWFIFAHKADGRNLLVGYLRQREDDGLWPLSRQICH